MPGKCSMIIFISLILFLSCGKKESAQNDPLSVSEEGRKLPLEYGTRFSMTDFNSCKELKVISPWPGSSDTFTYLLSRRENRENFVGKNNYEAKIVSPVKRLVCFSTTHLPYLEMLGEAETLVGFPTTSYISSEVFQERVKEGKIRDLGPSNEINLEALLDLNPDLVMAFTQNNDLSMIRKIQQAGISVVLNADYLEDHPLGRAEWIKFMAAFFDKEIVADSIFREIRSRYQSTRNRMDRVPERPTVFTGIVYGDTWFMPGGRNYGSIFFEDAGADYIWSDNPSREILQLSFESVYDRARNADFWVGVATYHSLREIRQADERYTEFKAFQNGNVYNYTAKLTPQGGNPYFEKGYARPDIILIDLSKIFHPEIMQEHRFYFYEKLF
jgi:iron complex transport system substrate-binding protein